MDPATSSILPRLCDVVVDRCSFGVLKGSTIETGQLQQLLDSSAVIVSDQIPNPKNHAQTNSTGKSVKDVKFQVSSFQPEGVVRLRATANVDHVDVMKLEYAVSTIPKALSSEAVVSKLGGTAAAEPPGSRDITRLLNLLPHWVLRHYNMQLPQGLKGSI